MTKTLYAEFTVNPGSEERVAELMRGLTERVRAEPGNLVFDPYTRTEDGRKYVVFEVYRDEAAFQEHITADYGLEFNRELAGLIEEDGSQLSWLEPLPHVPVA